MFSEYDKHLNKSMFLNDLDFKKLCMWTFTYKGKAYY